MPVPRIPRLCKALAGASALAAASLAGAEPRLAAGAYEGGEPRLVARLRADPRGDRVWRVGVELVPDPGWHVYWRNPGDTGLAPRIDWQLPGARFGEIDWPTPRAFRDAGDLMSFGYERPVLLATTARVPRGARELAVHVDALVCANLCLPGTFDLAIGLDPTAPDSEDRARFAATSLEVPRPVEQSGVQLAVETTADALEDGALRAVLTVLPCGPLPATASCGVVSAAGSRPGLLPYASPEAAWLASPPQPHPGAPGAFTVLLERTWLGAGPPAADPIVVAGVVPLRDANGRDVSVEISLAVASGGGEPAAAGTTPWLWLRAVLLGWLGGVILNLMPCVLPVLAIKLASLAALAHGSRREHHRHAAAYAGGIALSMLALAGAVVGLRAAGTAVGWGFQLQEPIFLVAISALLVALALNLFGAFEIEVDTGRLGGIGSGAPGAARSFFDGLLAVALATPCSAPFLGTAVGFAFASPAQVVVSIFLAIGLGLATPFVLAAFFPAVARRMPRSGAWMADLRGGLAFALLFTVVWLLWILGRVAGAGAIASALVLLLGIAAAGWALGLAQRRGRRVPATAFAGVLGAMAVLGIARLDLAPAADAGADVDPPVIQGARAFSASLVDESLDAGRPVFVYFTADWCVTCKLNERSVLADRRVEPELERLGYDVYHADWTRRDETIRGALALLGKAGVPVYALYAPDAPESPRLLPELLTVDGLLDALHDVAARRPTLESADAQRAAGERRRAPARG